MTQAESVRPGQDDQGSEQTLHNGKWIAQEGLDLGEAPSGEVEASNPSRQSRELQAVVLSSFERLGDTLGIAIALHAGTLARATGMPAAGYDVGTGPVAACTAATAGG